MEVGNVPTERSRFPLDFEIMLCFSEREDLENIRERNVEDDPEFRKKYGTKSLHILIDTYLHG